MHDVNQRGSMVSSKGALVSLRSLGLPKYRKIRFSESFQSRLNDLIRTNDRIQTIKELRQESGCDLPAAKSWVWHKTYECPETCALSLLWGTASIAPEPGNALSAGGTGTRNR